MSTSSLCFIHTQWSKSCAQAHTGRALRSYMAHGMDVESNYRWVKNWTKNPCLHLTSKTFLLMVFCLLHWIFLQCLFCESFSPQTFNTGDSGAHSFAFFPICLYSLVHHLVDFWLEISRTPTFLSLASSELQMHIPSWMLNKYLKLSMLLAKLPIISVFQWSKNLSANHSGQQPQSHHWVFSFTSLSYL